MLLSHAGGEREAKGPSIAPVYLHLMSSESRICLGPLENVGVDQGGMLLTAVFKGGRRREVTCRLDGASAVWYNHRRFEAWVINSVPEISKSEVIESPRTFHGVKS